ncbi:MAG: Primosomal protein N (Replication factor Y)-superfamily II helicase [Candidatus Moranbacteria bacterium GW2011_GWA2_39_41]|nr:MAG: Primosomal protein N (Replication factor Y)-superfamily II helicase [Candidatus Moranbacteria bacterium GW2011_GWA2_39_41]
MSTKQAKIIIDVVPIARIPLSRNQSFSYLSEVEITAGSLVEVPLFHRKAQGVVTGYRPDFARLGNIELKKVSSVLEENFLDKKQIELAQFISEYYFSPLGIVMKSFVPKRTKQRNKKQDTNPKQITNNIKLTKEQTDAVEKINTKYQIPNTKYLLCGPAGSGKTEVYIESIKQLKKNEQVLILVPELTLTPQAIERYSAQFGAENISVLTSKVSKGEFFTQWQKIKAGEIKIVIGTRMAVFAPFKKLGLIVVDEEQDMSFKQWDMNPRYDARTVAEKLAQLHKCKIIFGSATPSIESFQKTIDQEFVLVKIPHLQIPDAPKKDYDGPEVSIVDLKKEKWEKNHSPISRKLRSEIAYALKNGLQTILFINRQGMSSFSICAGCKTVLKCPKCERALIYDNSGVYKCVSCTFQSSITPTCSKCKGLIFQNIGLGTQKIEREMASMFASAKIARMDSQTMKEAGAQEKTYHDFAEGKIDILIGTQMLTKGWDLPNVALIGIIDADNMVSIPDFSVNFRAFSNIVQVSGRSNRPHAKFRGSVIIQTFNPNLEIFRFAAQRNFEKFFAREIKNRQDLSLPPFGKLIKLIFQDYDAKKVSTVTRTLYAMLEKSINEQVSISEPQKSFIANVRGRHREQIIIKLKNKELPAEIKTIIEALPTGWLIDVDPISII